MDRICAVVMAAGKGKRMKSSTPKVLHPILGRPMIEYVLGSVDRIGIRDVILLVGHGSEAVTAAVGSRAKSVVQEPQRGTGHAVQVAFTEVPAKSDTVMVLSGDQPLIDDDTLRAFIEHHRTSGAPVTVLTAVLPWDNDLGRVLRDERGGVKAIVEAREAPAEVRAIREVNLGTYLFDRKHLAEYLPKIGLPNAQNEIYLTDMISVTLEAGQKVEAVICPDPYASIGVNSRKELADVTKVLRERINERWMSEGVSIVDPDSTFIEPDVQIGRDTTILPFTFLSGRTRLGEGCVVGPSSKLVDCQLGNRVTVSYSVLTEMRAEDDVSVGPFAHLRPGTDLGPGVKVGDFVEIKNTRVEAKSKVPHLSYLGDAHLGERVNIGAGTITCNYDGKRKHRTEIEDDVHIGSNTNLVAPVRIGRGSTTGAGAVVTRDVPPESLAVGVPARVIERAASKD